MSLLSWVAGFAEFHARARAGSLPGEEMARYLDQRDELARMMVGAQALMAQPGQQPRRALRVARAFPVDLVQEGTTAGTTTLDVSSGGFSVLHKVPLAPAARVRFSMRLPRDGAVSGVAEVMGCVRHGALQRVSVQIAEMVDAERERLEFAVFDAVVDILQA